MGENLLNPKVFKICKYIKKKYVNSEIVILLNGTIPSANEEIVKYIDILGFSLDGGAKEVFEAFVHRKSLNMLWIQFING